MNLQLVLQKGLSIYSCIPSPFFQDLLNHKALNSFKLMKLLDGYSYWILALLRPFLLTYRGYVITSAIDQELGI